MVTKSFLRKGRNEPSLAEGRPVAPPQGDLCPWRLGRFQKESVTT